MVFFVTPFSRLLRGNNELSHCLNRAARVCQLHACNTEKIGLFADKKIGYHTCRQKRVSLRSTFLLSEQIVSGDDPGVLLLHLLLQCSKER